MITHFQVQNFKALRNVALELAPVHLLIGPNDSGKSSILEAIMALCRSVDHTLSEAFVGSWEGRSLVSRNSGADTVQLSAQLATAEGTIEYALSCHFPVTGRRVKPDFERVFLKDEKFDFDLPDHFEVSYVYQCIVQDKVPPNYHKCPPEEISRRRVVAQEIFDALAGVQLFRLNSSRLALPVAADSNRRFRMEPDGFGLAVCLDNILGYDRHLFGRLEDKFRQIFPQIKSIMLKPQPGWRGKVDDALRRPELSTGEGKGLYFTFNNGQGEVAAEQMSDGLMLVLGYLAVLYSPEPPRVLLVEEPENGIHPHRLRDVLGILRDLVASQQHTQVVMTTHSPYVVDLFEPSAVSLCSQNENGEVVVKCLNESPRVREQLNVFTLGEIWTSEGDAAISQ